MSATAKDQCVLIAISCVLFFVNLGVAPLWDRDEPRNAGCTAEMLAQDELVVPIFNDELRTHKPILLYWLMMISYAVFGVTEFGARAVSATLGISTVLLTYHIACRLFDRRTGFWAGLVLCSTLMFSLASRAATPDGLLIFCGTLAVYCFVRGSFIANPTGEGQWQSTDVLMPTGVWLYAMYGAMGLGVLAKGPVGVVLPTAVIGMYLLIMYLPKVESEGGWPKALALFRPFKPGHFLRTCWRMRPLTALSVAAAVAAPWYVWVHIRTEGVWTSEFFWLHNVSRASATMEGHSGPPVIFYVIAILVGFFPWSILAIPTALDVYHDVESGVRPQAKILLACWVGVYVGIFSLAQTKLPSYVTPCYPALAIFVGSFVRGWTEQQIIPSGWLKLGLAHWIAVGIGLVIGLPLAASRWLPGSQWLGMIGFVLLFGAGLCWWLLAKKMLHRAQFAFAVTAIGFVGLLQAFVPAEIGRHRKDAALFAAIKEHNGTVVAYGHLEPSWIFYGGKSIREFKAEQQVELADYLAGNPHALLLTTDRRKTPLQEEIPILQGYHTVCRSEYFLRDRELLLLKSSRIAAGNTNQRTLAVTN